jgi:8-amino-7-oxononanoate synthase
MNLWHELERELKRRESQDLRRFLRVVPPDVLDASSNDYLGLSRHPEVVEAAQLAALEFGTGARASRLVSGHTALHQQLETALARWKGNEAALVFSSGFAANIGVVTALANEETALFCHKRAHASLVDACRFASSTKEKLRFFETPAKLESLLGNSHANRKIIVVDGVFSMDGDVLPLPEIVELAHRFDALILLDDAHALGVLGTTGRGTSEHFQIVDERIVTLGTLSKALGSQGGFVTGPQTLIDYLVNSARSLVYLDGFESARRWRRFASASNHRTRTVARGKMPRQRAISGARTPQTWLRCAFSSVGDCPGFVDESQSALELSARLLEHGMWCPAIRPPTVKTARLRLTANAEWNEVELNRVVDAFN